MNKGAVWKTRKKSLVSRARRTKKIGRPWGIAAPYATAEGTKREWCRNKRWA